MKNKHLLLLLLLAVLAPWAAMAQTYNICEDFENVNVPQPDRITDPPSGWDLYCPNYDPYLADYIPGVCSSGSDYIFTRWPSNSQLLAVLGSNILFLPAGLEIDAGTVTYAIMPEYHKVSTITFNAWKENALYGTLELGYITSGDSNCSTYHKLQTVNLVSYQNATPNNASFSYNVSLPAATGYRLVFKWTQTNQDWYGAYIDNICVTVPKFHIANTASDTAMTWAQFVSHVNNGATYRGQTVYLDENITVNTMVGSGTTKSFQGQFEGQQHTITVNYTANGIYCAPFRYVKDASFHQLKITGTITNSSYKFTAGFAGYCDGTTQFTDCISNVTINSSVNGDGTHGGFIAYVPSSGNANFQACVFTGRLLGSNTHSCGGFCGFSDGSIYCYHCIFTPTQITMSSNNSATFSRVSSTSPYGFYLDHTNYYNQTFGMQQGYLMQKAVNVAPVTMAAYGEDSPDSPYHELTQIQYFPSYSDGLKYQGVLYASSTETVHVILGGGDSYRTSGATLNYYGSGGHYYFSLGNHLTLYIYAVFNVPSNLQYSNLNATSVGLNWTENGSANRWQICINNDENNLITSTSRWYTLNGLTPETAYMVKVRALRGDYFSAWTSNINFTTPAISAPTNLQCTAAATSATLNWTQNGSASTWQICLNGDETNLIDVSGRPYTFTGLTPETTYTAKVRAKIGEYYSVWSDEASFTTTAIPPASLPYTTDFETDCDWNLVNGDLTNAWTWGTAAHNGSGARGLYISNDGGTTNAYTNNSASSMVYATKSFNFNAGAYSFSFDWRGTGESNWDFLRVALVPDTISLEASTSLPTGLNHSTLPAGWIALDGGSQLNQTTDWQTTNNDVVIPAVGTYKMVFAWRNDGSMGDNPPAAIDNVSITQTSCITPSDLHYTSLTPTTATLAWTENGEATNWQICLNGDEDNLIDVTENPYTFTGLIPATAYTAKVRANCGGGDVSAWSNEIGFTTKQIPVDLPYATDFETTCDWVLVNGDLTNAWAWGEAAHNGEGTHGLYVSNDGGTTNAYTKTAGATVYATKSFNFNAGAYFFSFDWLANGENYNGYPYDYLRVALVPDTIVLKAVSWLPDGFLYDNLPSGWIALDGGSQLYLATEWQTISNEVVVPAAGTYKMVFAWRNDEIDGTNPPAAIDNVSITSVTCPAPTGLHLVQGSLSGHEVTIAWDNEELAQYQYALIQNDFIPDTITFNSPSLGNGQSHYNNLDPETSYTFFLRQYCSDDDQSGIVSLTFTTGEACPAPVDLAATEVYGYSAKLDWTASSDSYTVSYRTKAHTTVLYEQFDTNDVPTGWMTYSGFVDNVIAGTATLTEVVGGWYTNSLVFGDFNMKVNIFGSNCRYWLVTPEVNVSSNNTLMFDLALTDYNNSNPIENDTLQADDRFVVLVYADDSWTILREWNNTGSDDVYNTIATTGEQVSIDLSAYDGKTVKIAFYGESTVSGNGDNDLHIDNVGVGLPVPAGEWQTITVDEASAWLTGLTPETPYEAKVQGDCGDDGLSEETAIISFTTIEACPVPTELTAEESLMTPTTADLHWKGSIDVPYYTVMYRTAAGIHQPVFSEGFEHGLGDWTLRNCHEETGISGDSHHTGQNAFRFRFNTTPPQYLISPELSGVTEGMSLEFYYRNGSASYPETFHVGFSSTDNATESFTFGDEITASDAQWHLYSETIPAGTKYICWKLTSYDQLTLYIDDIAVGTSVSAGSWQNWSASTTNYKLIGLTPSTKYEAMVRSDCSDQWSETITFTTLPVFYYEDFEAGCDWTLINGTCTNAWAWGQASYNWLGNGNHGLYISNDNGSSNTYTVDGAPSMVYAAKTLEFEAGAYLFSYDWQCTGYRNADFLRVALVPDSVVLEAGTTAPTGFSSSSLPSGWIALDDGSQLVYSSGWQQKRSAVVVPASGTYNLVFAWINNNWGGMDPPASVDNVCIEIPSCSFISDLHYTDLTPTTATLAWSENGEATNWQICLNGDEDNLIDVTENPYTFTGLTPVTAYTIRVRANCGDGDVSIWSDELRFTTKQPAASIPYATGFENTCDWVLVNGDRPNAWAWGEAAHNGEGTHGIYISNDGGATNAFTFNEAISMVYATKTFLFEPGLYTFTYDWRAYGYTNNDFLRVLLVPETVVFEAGTSLPNTGFYGYSSSLPEDWIALDGNLQLLSATEWQTMNQEVVVPTAGLYNMVFAWYNDEWSGDNPPAAIDNVSITPLSCAQPTHLSCTAITATTVTLSWTENYEATAWQICLNDDETNLIDVTENPYTLTSLTPETNYSVKVRAHCSEDNFSAWSDPVTFEASDKIVIGSGTASSSMFPTFVHNNYYQTQQIYTVDELGDAGNIVSIDYFMTTPAACQRNLDIYMVHTDAFAFQTPPNLEWIPVTAADLVFSGTVDFVNGWWTTITLDSPFAYDGQHNVAILVDDNTGSTINTNVEFLSYTATGYQSAFYFAGSTNVDPTTNTSYTAPERTKNQIRVLKQRSVTQTLNLSAGVNWVSFYVETTLDDLKAALVSASNNASGIKITSQSNGFTSWNGSSWRGTLNSIDVSQMYVIEVPATCAISLEAMPINPAEHPITIVNGINWIGFPVSADMTLTNAFSGFAVNGDKVTSLTNGSANYQGLWSGGLSTLQPGQGYKLEVTTTEQRTLVFPSGAKKATPFNPMGK